MVDAAATYEITPDFANPVSSLVSGKRLQSFAEKVTALAAGAPPPDVVKALEPLISATFGFSPNALVARADFQSDWDRICNSIVALFITPAAGRDLLGPLATLLRMIDLIRRVARADTSLNAPGALAEALTRTLLLPPRKPLRERRGEYSGRMQELHPTGGEVHLHRDAVFHRLR